MTSQETTVRIGFTLVLALATLATALGASVWFFVAWTVGFALISIIRWAVDR